MHVWVLNTFTRDDEFCEHDSNIVAVYSKGRFKEARKRFSELCNANILDDEDEDEKCKTSRWKDENGYHFSSELEGYNGFKQNYVGLVKKELM